MEERAKRPPLMELAPDIRRLMIKAIDTAEVGKPFEFGYRSPDYEVMGTGHIEGNWYEYPCVLDDPYDRFFIGLRGGVDSLTVTVYSAGSEIMPAASEVGALREYLDRELDEYAAHLRIN